MVQHNSNGLDVTHLSAGRPPVKTLPGFVRMMQGASLGVLAMAAAASAHAQEAPATQTGQAAPSAPAAQLQEIVVTGTSIRGVAPTGSAIVSVTRQDINAIAAVTTQDILRDMPGLGAFQTFQAPTNDFGQVGIKPSVHNIGAGATLTLMDGHRLVGAGILQTNADLSVIPPSAIQRVEVVADGASATYGSDAIAGVVNIILRKNYDGAETSAKYGSAKNYWTYDLNQVFGKTWDGGSFMIAGEYTRNSPLFGRQRSFVTQDMRRLGYIDTRSNAAIPPNISVGGTTYSYPGFTTTPNLYDTSQVGSLVPDASRYSVLATAHQQITPQLEAYGEVFYSERLSRNTIDPGGQTPAIASTNPFYVQVPGAPVGATETVRMNMLPITGPLYTPSNLKGSGLTLGLNYDIGHGWRATLEGNLGHEDDHNDGGVINATNFNAAAAGTTAATALDPFTGRTNPSVVAGLVGDNASRAVQELREVSLKADGPVFKLPAGDIRLAVGVQYHYESLSQSYNTIGVTNTLVSNLNRNFLSEYGEILVPILGGDFSYPGFRRLDLDVAIRHDQYSDAGGTTNPKVGFTWSPLGGMNIHGSYGTSFHAPPLADKNPASIDTRVQPLFASTTFAPTGAAPSNYFYLAGSYAGLTPEKAKTWSFGGDYRPSVIPGLQFGATWWHVLYSNIVSIAFPPALYTDPSLAQYYVNNPTDAQIAAFIGNLRVDGLACQDTACKVAYLHGATRMIDLRRKNLGIIDATGVDFNANYRHAIGPGMATFDWTGTVMNGWLTQVSPTAAKVDNFAAGTQIRWRSRTTATYSYSDYSLMLAYNYLGGYTNLSVAAQPIVQPYKTFDLAATYNMHGPSLLKGVQLQLNVDNIGDQNPPVRVGNTAGYSGVSNPIGRTISIGIRKTW